MENRCGFITLIGPTNSGKSTLLNALIGQKLSIVSPKVQTTYHRIKGIRTEENAQLIFVDTPGFQNYPKQIPRMLNQIATEGALGSDVVLWVFDVSKANWRFQLDKLKDRLGSQFQNEIHILVMNKVDLVAKPKLLPEMEAVFALQFFKEIIPVSALKEIGIESIVKAVTPYLPEREFYFSKDDLTDRPESFFVTEYVREQIYLALHEELPYSTYIELEKWEAHPDPKKICPTLHITIHIDSSSRKKILVGSGGLQLKNIGVQARKTIETFLGHKICLKLFVKVEDSWQENGKFLKTLLEMDSAHA